VGLARTFTGLYIETSQCQNHENAEPEEEYFTQEAIDLEFDSTLGKSLTEYFGPSK
jgi:hypothetical protein